MSSWPGGYGLEPLWPHSADHLNAAIQADIIFLHGLNGDPAHTWSCHGPNGKRISWLSDIGFLPSMIPLSRIFTFKYNAKILNYNSDAALEDISKSLLSHLQSIRLTVEETNRKLLFVCHSLGGLVVKQALILNAETPALHAIQNKTSGIIFLGTPHGGSHLGRSLARIAFVTGSSKDLSSVLSINSAPLNKLSEEFKDYYMKRLSGNDNAAPRLKIRSFAEMDRTYIAHTPIATKVVPLKSAQTNLDREIVTPVNKDHHTICRFASPDDPVFVMIWRQLAEWMAQPGKEIPAGSDSLARRLKEEAEQYYDAPLKTENFVGREEDLQILSDALFRGGRETHRSVGLYGQGGIGKTQLAIEFARVHKSYYKTVKFFNARSREDLRASIEKFFDSLIERKDERMQKTSGKDCKDKIAAVMKWFHEERDWLLVYDDADFDPPYDPRPYFPQDTGGHLILIGRGPSVTNFAETAVELVAMNRTDAVQMLLVRSKFARQAGSPSVESEEALMKSAANSIANELHDMPGFIEVAAKYILHCQPSLTEYLQMLRNKKQNMRLESEKGVLGDAFASWELAMNKLQTKPASMLLLKLFAFLDGSILCEQLRSRASSPARRWNKNGEEVERSPQWSGIDQAVIDIIVDSESFDAAVTPLINASFLRKHHAGSTSKIEMLQTIQQFVQWSLTPNEQLHWAMQAIRVISHALPEGPNQDTRFESLRIDFTPHVFRCIDHERKYKFSLDQLKEVLPNLMIMLLASLARSGTELDFVEELAAAQGDGYYKCLASKWRGYSLFYQNRKREAEQLLAHVQALEEEQEQLATDNGHPLNPRAHAALGDLIMHRAQFLFNEGRYNESEEAIRSWKPISASTYEKRTKLDLDTALDKVRVATGQIDLAVAHLKEVVERGRPGFEDPGLKSSDVNWATVILCQVYCLQGKYEEVISVLQPRIEMLVSSESQAEFITSDFRTLFCEALMGLERYEQAEQELTSLRRDLRLPAQIDNKRASNQRFATMRMIARCYHLQKQWEKAAEAWIQALEHEKITENEILSGNFDQKRYEILISIYSLGLAYLHLGDKKRAQQYIDTAKADPVALEYPRGKTDYAQWKARIEEECSAALNESHRGLNLWRLFIGRGDRR